VSQIDVRPNVRYRGLSGNVADRTKPTLTTRLGHEHEIEVILCLLGASRRPSFLLQQEEAAAVAHA
jgi:hypothetical protein